MKNITKPENIKPNKKEIKAEAMQTSKTENEP
jgi:hypothetical protein